MSGFLTKKKRDFLFRITWTFQGLQKIQASLLFLSGIVIFSLVRNDPKREKIERLAMFCLLFLSCASACLSVSRTSRISRVYRRKIGAMVWGRGGGVGGVTAKNVLQTQREAVGEVKVDLEKRAQRLARRLEEERASKDEERIAHESALLAVRTQVN